MINDS